MVVRVIWFICIRLGYWSYFFIWVLCWLTICFFPFWWYSQQFIYSWIYVFQLCYKRNTVKEINALFANKINNIAICVFVEVKNIIYCSIIVLKFQVFIKFRHKSCKNLFALPTLYVVKSIILTEELFVISRQFVILISDIGAKDKSTDGKLIFDFWVGVPVSSFTAWN